MSATVDLDRLKAIDVHTHVQASIRGGGFPDDSPERAVAEVFGSDALLTVPELAAFYRERDMLAVCFMVDSVRWGGPVSNEEILELAAGERDALIPFVSIDPNRGAEGVEWARRLIAEHDVRGFKFHPSLQHFFPDDRMAYPLYEVIAEHKLPVVFHTGQTAVGSGQRGGGGILMKYSNPIHLDEVAADFPDMQVVMAHPSVPWQDEALSIAVHKPNVWIDLSRLVAEVLPAAARALRQQPAEGEGPVRDRLPGADAGALAARLRHAADQGRGPAADPQGERACGCSASTGPEAAAPARSRRARARSPSARRRP